MKICVQKIQLEKNIYLWLVIDKNGLPVECIEGFIGYQFNKRSRPLKAFATTTNIFSFFLKTYRIFGIFPQAVSYYRA